MYSKKAYLQTRVQTASPGELLVMLYDGLVRFIAEAGKAVEENRPADAGRANGRALDILHHLIDTLKPEHSPELCDQLRDLYMTWSQILVRSLAQADSESYVRVREQVEHMRDSWREASRIAESGEESTDSDVASAAG